MKKTLIALTAASFAGLLSLAHAAEGQAPAAPAAAGQEQKAQNMEKKHVKKHTKKQTHKQDSAPAK